MDFFTGQIIHHPKYANGEVTRIRGFDDNPEITVLFPAGEQKFLAKELKKILEESVIEGSTDMAEKNEKPWEDLKETPSSNRPSSQGAFSKSSMDYKPTQPSYNTSFGEKQKSESSSQTSSSPFALEYEQIKKALRQVLEEEGVIGHVPLADKWKGGEVILQPSRGDLMPKSIPMEQFFHKIVLIRDRLRVLEQHINSNSNLSENEKVDFQQYITRCYGSLTSFNVLFRDRKDWFIGEKTKF